MLTLNFDTDLFPTPGPRWDWDTSRFATAYLAVHEAAHAVVAHKLGSTTIRVEIGANFNGMTRFNLPDSLTPAARIERQLLVTMAGTRVEHVWWSEFTKLYNPSVAAMRSLAAVGRPEKPSRVDTALIKELMSKPNPFNGDFDALEFATDDLVHAHWNAIQSCARVLLSKKGRMQLVRS